MAVLLLYTVFENYPTAAERVFCGVEHRNVCSLELTSQRQRITIFLVHWKLNPWNAGICQWMSLPYIANLLQINMQKFANVSAVFVDITLNKITAESTLDTQECRVLMVSGKHGPVQSQHSRKNLSYLNLSQGFTIFGMFYHYKGKLRKQIIKMMQQFVRNKCVGQVSVLEL